MGTAKIRLKSIIPVSVWEYLRKRKGIFLDVIFNFGSFVCRKRYCGFVVYYNRGNSLIDRLRGEKYYEQKLCENIIADIEKSKNKSFMDIGANIGLVSTYVAARIPGLKVSAFEPGPLQRGFLEKTVAHNNLQKTITIYKNAFGNKIERRMFTSHGAHDVAKDGFLDTKRGSQVVSIEVAVETIDYWWQSKGRPQVDVVKIDTEGAELWILEGGNMFLSLIKPVVYLEIEPANLKAYPYTALDILKFLHTLKYDLYTLDGVVCSEKNLSTLLETEDTYKAISRA